MIKDVDKDIRGFGSALNTSITLFETSQGKGNATGKKPKLPKKPIVNTNLPVIGIPEGSPKYVEAVMKAGGAPIVIGSTNSRSVLLTIGKLLDGLLLPGGVDIHPSTYGEKLSGAFGCDRLRDEAELVLARYALKRNLPILGICRGHQMLNVALGGSLYQDIHSHKPYARGETWISHRAQTLRRSEPTHIVELESDSALAEILGYNSIAVNSFHHQAVNVAGEGLQVVGYAHDDVIEATESINLQERWLVSVQWHPEELVGESLWAKRLFSSFVAAANNYRIDKQP